MEQYCLDWRQERTWYMQKCRKQRKYVAVEFCSSTALWGKPQVDIWPLLLQLMAALKASHSQIQRDCGGRLSRFRRGCLSHRASSWYCLSHLMISFLLLSASVWTNKVTDCFYSDHQQTLSASTQSTFQFPPSGLSCCCPTPFPSLPPRV